MNGRQNVRIGNEDRRRIIKAYNDSDDWQLVAEILNIKRQSAYNIIKIYNETGRIDQLPRGGDHSSKIDEETKALLIGYIEEKPTITLEEMRSRLIAEGRPSVSVQTISRALDASLISIKDLRTIPTQWNLPEYKAERKQYAEWFMENGIQARPIIFLDEFGFNVYTSRTKGRSAVGARAVRTVSSQRGQNLTICMAISPQLGFVHHFFTMGGLTKEKFADILSEIDALVEEPFYLLCDNAACHGDPPEMNDEEHEIVRLPRFSPYLNAAEYAGSCLKSHVKQRLSDPSIQQEIGDRDAARQAGQTLQARRLLILRREITACIPQLTREKCMSWYNHTMKYFPKCLSEQDIFD